MRATTLTLVAGIAIAALAAPAALSSFGVDVAGIANDAAALVDLCTHNRQVEEKETTDPETGETTTETKNNCGGISLKA